MPKPSENEEEYFARIEQELRKKREELKERHYGEKEKAELKKLHFMKCPKCGMDLVEVDFMGMKVDECSLCRGFWLDAGEFNAMCNIETPVLQKLFSVFKR